MRFHNRPGIHSALVITLLVTAVMLNPGPTLTEHHEYLRGSPIMLETAFTVENMIDTIDAITIEEIGSFLRYDGVPEAW